MSVQQQRTNITHIFFYRLCDSISFIGCERLCVNMYSGPRVHRTRVCAHSVHPHTRDHDRGMQIKKIAEQKTFALALFYGIT